MEQGGGADGQGDNNSRPDCVTPQTPRMSKEEAIAACDEAHRVYINCMHNLTMFSFGACQAEQKAFWDCFNDKRGVKKEPFFKRSWGYRKIELDKQQQDEYNRKK